MATISKTLAAAIGHAALLLAMAFPGDTVAIAATRDITGLPLDCSESSFGKTASRVVFSFKYHGSAINLSDWQQNVAKKVLIRQEISDAFDWSHALLNKTTPIAYGELFKYTFSKLGEPLKFSAVCTYFIRSRAVKWHLEFFAESETGPISEVAVAHLSVDAQQTHAFVPLLQTARGSSSFDKYRNDFTPSTRQLHGVPVTLEPYSESDWGDDKKPCSVGRECRAGRSSDGTLPYFNIQLGKNQGAAFGVGWSGQWKAIIGQNGPITEVSVGLSELSGPATSLRLRAEETVRFPSITVIPWTGASLEVGTNMLRQFIRNDLSPRMDGKTIESAIYASPHGKYNHLELEGLNVEHLAQNLARNEIRGVVGGVAPVVSRCHLKNIRLIAIDAGWPLDVDGDKWPRVMFKNPEKIECRKELETNIACIPLSSGLQWDYVGDWRPSSQRFPKGMRYISNEISKSGRTLSLWIEPERVRRLTDAWYATWWSPGEPDRGTQKVPDPVWRDQYAMINIASPEVEAKLKELLIRFIEDNGVGVLRLDFNHPTPFKSWTYADRLQGRAGRNGITELKYINALYRILDAVAEKFPHVAIDNSASGGRRLDVEMMMRSFPFWRSDIGQDDVDDGKVKVQPFQQDHMRHLSRWLPVHGSAARGLDKYSFYSGMSPVMGVVSQEMFDYNSPAWQLLSLRMAEYSVVRKYYAENFFDLSPAEAGIPQEIKAWQFIRQNATSGVLQIFRNGGAQTTNVKPVGLVSEAMYHVYDMDELSSPFRERCSPSEGIFSKAVRVQTGASLMRDGLPVEFRDENDAKIYVLNQGKLEK